MAKITEIVLFHSNDTGVVPTSSQLVEGEIALNTVDKRLFTEDDSATVVEIGTNPTSVTTGALSSTGITCSGTVNGTVITASTNFAGPITGAVTGNVTGDVTGNLTGNVTGNITGSGSSSLTTLATTNLTAGGLAYPTADGSPSTVLSTDGSGTISFISIAGAYDLATQAEAEAGTETTGKIFSPLRVKQAIDALAPSTIAVGSITGLATGVATFLATSSSANLASAVTDETGSGSLVFATSPTLVTPALGTPTSGVLTNATGLPNSSVIGLGSAALVATGTSSGNVPLVGTKSSTTTLAGLVERSTSAENVTGTDDTVYPTVAGTKEMIDTHGGSETTLTKTFAADETSTMTLGSSVTAPVIGVTKEVAQVAVTNNDWDAAAGSYTLEDSAPATTLAFVGDFSSSSYTQNFSVSSQDSDPRGIAFNTDGTKMFVVGYSADDVHEYALTTGFDISTASFTQTFSVAGQDLTPKGLEFNTDGTKMFVVGAWGDDVNEYALSTGFNISTASFTDSFSVASQDANPEGIAFNADGTKMFVVGNDGNDVNEYTLSTGFDVSTASFVDAFSVSSQDTDPQGLAFNTDGTKMYVVGGAGVDVNEYTLTTGFDVSTASYTQNFSVSSQDSQPKGITFNPDSTKMFVVGGNGVDVNEYAIPVKLTLGTGSFASADVGKTIEINSGVLILTATTGTYSETTAPSSTATAASGEWSMYAVVYDTVADVLETSAYDNAYYLAGASYDSVLMWVTQDTSPQSMAFSTDGTKMFVLGLTGVDVNEYTLSVGFDLSSTVAFVDSFSVSSQESDPCGLAFNTDGTKMFVTGVSGNDVNEYTLSTGWDVSTASFVDAFSVSSQTTQPRGVAFNTDGTKMYVVTDQTDYRFVYQYTLSTGFDVSTASYASLSLNIASQDTAPNDLVFNSDGTKMFIIGSTNDKVYQYTLSTAFNVSTASYDSISFSTTGQSETSPTGLAFGAGGTKMFIVGTAMDAVFQYSTGSISIPTGYQPCIGSNIDSTYWTDINSLTATNAVGDGNVFYAISNDDKTTWSVLDNTSGVRPIARVSGGTWQYNSNTTYASTTWTSATVNTEIQALRDSMTRVDGFILADAAYDSVNYSVASQETAPKGIAFNTDGTKMFITGDIGKDVNEYTLSVGFDLSSTIAFVDAFSVSAQEDSPKGVSFNTDGTKMFIVGSNGDEVNEYALTTGFDVSTASFTDAFDVSPQELSPSGMAFNADGTKMFIVGLNGDTVDEYALSTGFDVSTASFTDSFDISAQDGTPGGMAFNTDGTKMFVIGEVGQDVNEYGLTTGFDVSTASYTQNFSVSSQGTYPTGIAFNADGTKMYVIDDSGNAVYQYSTSGTVAYSTNKMNSTTLNAITDANQISLGTDLDFAVIMYIDTGTSVPTYSGTAINYDAAVKNQGAILGTDYNFDAPAGDKVRITAVGAGNYKIRVV